MLTTDQLLQIFADGLGNEVVGGDVFPCRAKSDPARALMGLLAQLILGQQTPFRGNPNISSGTISDNDIPQDIAAEDLTRSYVEIINTSASGTFWINFGADADNTASYAIPVVAGGGWFSPPNWCPTGRVSIAGTASDKFTIITA